MLVQITKEHIKYGRPGKARSCALALALDSLGFKEVVVNAGNIGIGLLTKDNKDMWFCVGSSLNVWISSFDSGKKVLPIKVLFDFEHEKAEIVDD